MTNSSWQKIDMVFLTNYATTWLYDLTLTQHKHDSKRYVLTVKPPTIKWPPYMKVGDVFAKDKYAHFIIKVLKSLIGVNACNKLDKQILLQDIHDMLDFEESLVKISSPKDFPCLDVEKTLESLQKLYSPVLKYAKIDWITRITTLLRIPGNELIYVTCDRYIEKLVTLLKSTPEKVVVNYIHWSFIVQVWPLVVQSLRNEFYPKNKHKPSKIS
ncbi:hypothetical protein KM043_016638 [Ampulex compressa]|nr:hypothetical protein KM043_016638 [Ampulex compressa]